MHDGFLLEKFLARYLWNRDLGGIRWLIKLCHRQANTFTYLNGVTDRYHRNIDCILIVKISIWFITGQQDSAWYTARHFWLFDFGFVSSTTVQRQLICIFLGVSQWVNHWTSFFSFESVWSRKYLIYYIYCGDPLLGHTVSIKCVSLIRVKVWGLRVIVVKLSCTTVNEELITI